MKSQSKTGEVAQQVRAFSALAEDLGLIPTTHIRQHKLPVTLVPRDPMPSSGLQGHSKHMVHILTHRYTYMYVYKYINNFYEKPVKEERMTSRKGQKKCIKGHSLNINSHQVPG